MSLREVIQEQVRRLRTALRGTPQPAVDPNSLLATDLPPAPPTPTLNTEILRTEPPKIPDPPPWTTSLRNYGMQFSGAAYSISSPPPQDPADSPVTPPDLYDWAKRVEDLILEIFPVAAQNRKWRRSTNLFQGLWLVQHSPAVTVTGTFASTACVLSLSVKDPLVVTAAQTSVSREAFPAPASADIGDLADYFGWLAQAADLIQTRLNPAAMPHAMASDGKSYLPPAISNWIGRGTVFVGRVQSYVHPPGTRKSRPALPSKRQASCTACNGWGGFRQYDLFGNITSSTPCTSCIPDCKVCLDSRVDEDGLACQSCCICQSCGNEIDPDCCHCGDSPENHDYSIGHRFIAAGCTCGYETSGDDSYFDDTPPPLTMQSDAPATLTNTTINPVPCTSCGEVNKGGCADRCNRCGTYFQSPSSGLQPVKSPPTSNTCGVCGWSGPIHDKCPACASPAKPAGFYKIA